MRRLSLFALIFIVMAGLYWLLEGSDSKHAVREPDHLLRGFEPANVERINITGSSTDAIALQRTDNVWQVATSKGTTHAADNSAVQSLLESLIKLKAGSMVSRKPDRHALYEVSPETGLHIKALNHKKQTLADLLIGKSGPNIFSTYVRVADSDKVYLVDSILQNKVSKSLNEWRDKTIFAFDPELAITYTVTGDPSLTLKKTDGEWRLESENAPANTTAIEQTVRTLATLSAVDFAEGPLEEFDLAAPARTVTAEFEDGTHATLLLGRDANAFQQYAKTTDAETIYIVEKHILGMLCPTIEDLKAPEPEEGAPTESQPATSR